MLPKYPVAKKYKVPQSQVRYNYNKPNAIKRKAEEYLKLRRSLGLTKLHRVKSDLIIDALDYFVNIVKKWDKKSKEINGWTSCFLTTSVVGEILKGCKQKYGYTCKFIEFVNVEMIYQIVDVENRNIWPLNDLVFALFVVCEENSEYNQFYYVQQVLQVLAQRQVLYHIAYYGSRKQRRYQLPWERIDDPVIDYHKSYRINREKRNKIRKNLKIDKTQSKINYFFPDVAEQALLNYFFDDDEIIAILEELDNEKS